MTAFQFFSLSMIKLEVIRLKELKGKQLLLIGFTLFSMFFGAGNLIFPPFLGAQAGTNTWLAFIGFALSAIGLPILGVISVARSGGLKRLANRVHPAFSAVFTMLIYLSIGPCLAIPRTASSSFEMAVIPFLQSGGIPVWLLQLIYSAIFFTAAFFLALHPEKLTDRLGKILCPALLVLIVVIFIGCIVRPVGGYASPAAAYASHAVTQGFLDGYQTMDTIAALNFGIVIALNIRARGIKEESGVVKGTIRAGWIAGAMLLAIYAMLTQIGAISGGAYPGAANGAQTLTNLVSALYGRWGMLILAAIFVIACFNTCVGLLSCCSEYFAGLFPKIPYKLYVFFFAAASMLISNAGLTRILKISLPVLSALYPVAIVLILLSFFQKWLAGKRFVYPAAILLTSVASILYAVSDAGLMLPAVTRVIDKVPLAAVGLGWVLPAAAGVLLGLLLSRLSQIKKKRIQSA